MSDNHSKSWLEQIGDVLSSEPQDREQLVEMLREAKQKDLLDAEALAMIESTLLLSEMRVRDVMVPRSQMTFVKEDGSLQNFIKTASESGRSRFPLFDEDGEKVIGLMFAKDLLAFFSEQKEAFSPRNVMRKVMFVPESKRLDSLLREFKAEHHHMAMVIDEYGNVSGLVTIEDVLEQIVGDIEDEHDIEEEEDNIKSFKEGHSVVKALTPIEDFNEHFGSTFSDEEFDTIGGLLLKQFECLPKRGDSVEVQGFSFTVLHADNRRLRLLEVTKS